MDELSGWLSLARIPGLHAGHLQPLLTRFGSPRAILTASTAELTAADVRPKLIEALRQHRTAAIERDRRWLDHTQHHLVTWGSPDYPPLLAQLPDAPIVLFIRGSRDAVALPQLAIVGSRNPTPSGRETARQFAAHLARCGLIVTSGLAAGIDAAAHQGALDAAAITIAVCGTGLDIVYPSNHAALAAAIAQQGALVSEFPPGVSARRENFPRRNRIIAGLSLGTLVVEAALRSGSLITARLAAEQGREVFAIPGSIHNPLARGCHQLIRDGARLVETADDIFSELRSLCAALPHSPPLTEALDATGVSLRALDKGYEILLDALGFEPAGVDQLIARTGLRADEVASMLLILELEGRIESSPGGLYVRHAQGYEVK